MCILHDESSDNVRALLSEPSIARTEFLDPATLQPTERQTVSALYWLSLQHPDLRLLRLIRPLGAAPLFVWLLLFSLCVTADGRRWLRESRWRLRRQWDSSALGWRWRWRQWFTARFRQRSLCHTSTTRVPCASRCWSCSGLARWRVLLGGVSGTLHRCQLGQRAGARLQPAVEGNVADGVRAVGRRTERRPVVPAD